MLFYTLLVYKNATKDIGYSTNNPSKNKFYVSMCFLTKTIEYLNFIKPTRYLYYTVIHCV